MRVRAWQREQEDGEAAEGRRRQAAQARRGEEARRTQAGNPAALLVSAAAACLRLRWISFCCYSLLALAVCLFNFALTSVRCDSVSLI